MTPEQGNHHRPSGIRGPAPIMTAAQIREARRRLQIRRRALAIARRHSDKRIARDLGVPHGIVRHADNPTHYKWLAW